MFDEVIHIFNSQPSEEARAALLACCGSTRWADTLVAMRPFNDAAGLSSQGERVWVELNEADWLEAFACHPRIGERKAATTDYLVHSASEQAAAQQTLEDVAVALIAGNRAYEEKFGFLYIVFASGRSALELLEVLQQRLEHTRAEELHEAARQQQRITELRMTRWLQC